jgi:hypothetical protein
VRLRQQKRIAEFIGERLQAVLAARGGDDPMAAFNKGASDGGAESRGRSGDEHNHCSSLVGKRQRPQAYFQCRAAARMHEPHEGP